VLRSLGRLVVISGPSGAGKTTLSTGLLESETTLKRIVTFTTRDPRPGEIDGADYHFVTEREFADLFTSDRALDVATVGDARYGLTLASVTVVLDRGWVPIVVVDPIGGIRIAERIPSLTMFVTAPLEELRLRLLRRGYSDSVIESRLGSYSADVAIGARYQHQFDGGSADRVLEAARAVLLSAPVNPGGPSR
jgi:guanylate kinase